MEAARGIARESYTYAVPDGMDLVPGSRVTVPFGRRSTYGFVVSLGTEGYRIADELAKRKVSVVVHPTMQRAGGSMETMHTALGNAADDAREALGLVVI